MRVLLDENLPLDLANEIAGHDVETVIGAGWAGVANGKLLARASGRYDAFVTMDRNIQHQQNIAKLSFGVVLVRAVSNRLVHLRPLLPEILVALEALKPGELRQVGN